jgi:ATP/maltotriose-dependent transcriptional regulator MalT/DNA-binding SARP family transcriptional activator
VSNRHAPPTDEPVAMPPLPESQTNNPPGSPDSAGAARAAQETSPDLFPIQLAKVQRPPLRSETLRRDRLLEWLSVKVHHRIVYVTADAGYGKTTLLADFARRSRLPTLWYRLDEDDRNWVSFVNYVVTAGRQIDPGFASATSGLLRELATAGPSRGTIVETLIRELQQLARGAVLILDDYHLIDDVPDVRSIIREVITRAPERLTLVFASRREPTIPVARLRAQGEVAELTTDDLRFDRDETERLFRESYGRPLEADVLTDLSQRTEGWAASLQLVQSALRDRSAADVRAFIRGLSGAHGDLHDYLAEEVVGELGATTQQFLMRTSILQTVEPELASLTTETSVEESARSIELCESLGLLSRRGESTDLSQRYHPLVRDFLEARLRAEIGASGVKDLHRLVARHLDGVDWRLAAHHFAAAEDVAAVHRVITAAIQTIMGNGEFALAESYIDRYPERSSNAAFEMVLSRAEMNRDRVGAALERGRKALESFAKDDDSNLANLTRANLVSLLYAVGRLSESRDRAVELERRNPAPGLQMIASATRLALETSLDGDMAHYLDHLLEMARTQRLAGQHHYLGITQLNLAVVYRGMGDGGHAVESASEAIELLTATSAGHEVAAARSAMACGLGHLGRLAEARSVYAIAVSSAHAVAKAEVLTEAADIENWYGDATIAEQLLRESEDYASWQPQVVGMRELGLAYSFLRQGRVEEAGNLLQRLGPPEYSGESAHHARRLATEALHARCAHGSNARATADQALGWATRQRSGLWIRFSRVLDALGRPTPAMNVALRSVSQQDPAVLSMAAEVIVERIGDFDPANLAEVTREVELRPERWRGALRKQIRSIDKHGVASARLLDQIGTESDVALLRDLARHARGSLRDPGLGKGLARRLAPKVLVNDLGRVSISIGDRVVHGTELRRKVLALLCFLITRPDASATKDEVLEGLWPDLDPGVAVNSLNQTVYFLRRVFEPGYKDGLSAGYVHHDSDVLWLDQVLVQCRSVRCRGALRAARDSQDADVIEAATAEYTGRFALDFAYEDWASAYRDSLHAAYLEVIERSVMEDTRGAHFDRAIVLARRAVEVDPEADGIEVSLLRLYRLTGAHAAAAEQYGHYASVMREQLGIEPPALESL